MFRAWRNDEDSKGWITFEGLSEYGGDGFDTSSGTYTVPEDGIYIFGLQARSGNRRTWNRINYYKTNTVAQTVVTDGNAKDNWNNFGTTWTDTLKKGDKVCLKVFHGTVDGYLNWYGGEFVYLLISKIRQKFDIVLFTTYTYKIN